MVELGEIKSKLLEFKASIQKQSDVVDKISFRDQVKKAYYRRILHDIAVLLDDHGDDQEKLRSAFIDYLKSNEKLIHGSALYYTCTPQEPVTKLLCLIAEWVSAMSPKDTPVSAISVLMPSLDLVSKNTIKYPSLCLEKENIIQDKFSKNDLDSYARLSRILFKERKKETLELLATLDAKREQAKFYTEHCNEVNGWRIPKMSIECVLKSHILSEDGRTLIPISLVTEDDPINPYCASFAKLTDDEKLRIKKHSITTKCFLSVKEKYENLRHNPSHLLGQLNALRTGLKLHDAHGGLGSQASAASGAYNVIINFNDYYRDLSDEVKLKIPDAVKTEIQLLLDLSSDKNQNKNATAQMQTCIGTRGEELDRAIKKHENELFFLNRTKEQHQSALSSAKEIETAHRDALQKQLSSGTYSGEDKLPYRASLLKEFKILFTIQTKADFNNFMEMSTADMVEIAKIKGIYKALCNTIVDPSEFAAFIRETPDIKLKSYFGIVSENPKPLVPLNSIDNVRAVFFEISASKIRLLLDTAKFAPNIKTAIALGQVSRPLSPEQRTAVFEFIKGRLPSFILTADDLGAFLQYLNPEQFREIFELLENQRSLNIIQTGKRLGEVLRPLTPEQCLDVFNLLKSKLPDILVLANDYANVLAPLSLESRAAVYERLKASIVSVIRNACAFRTILSSLSSKQCSEVYTLLKNRLPGIIASAADLGSVVEFLTIDESIAVCVSLTNELPRIIQSGRHLGMVFSNLLPQKCHALCKVLKERLLYVIKKDRQNGFTSFLEQLSAEQSLGVCQSLNEQEIITQICLSFNVNYRLMPPATFQHVYELINSDLPRTIQTAGHFMRTFRTLTRQQRTAIYESIKERLPQLIEGPIDLNGVMIVLSLEQRLVVLESMKDRLPIIIKSVADFCNLLHHFSPKNCEIVCDLLDEQLPCIISSNTELSQAFLHLSLQHCNELCVSLKKRQPSIIKSVTDFIMILSQLPGDKFRLLCRSFKEEISGIINSCSNLVLVLNQLTYWQCDAVCESLKEQLPDIIKTDVDLISVIGDLKPIQCTVVCESLKGRLPDIFKNCVDLGWFLNALTSEQSFAVCESLKRQLPGLIKNGSDLAATLYHLTPEQCGILCNSLKNHLPMIIQTADHVSDAIQFLTLEQRAAVYASIKSHLINLISSNHDLNLVLKKLLPEEKKELIGLVSSSHRFFGKALVLQAPITERKILQKL